MSKGWIALHRSLLDHYLWEDKPFSKGQAWIDLLLIANYEDKKAIRQGEFITYRRGSVNRSIHSLAERWGWDKRKVKRFLMALESDGMVSVNSTTRGTTITIEKYSVYQSGGTTDSTSNGTIDGTQITNKTNKTRYTRSGSKSKIHNFSERKTDYDQLERTLTK